MADEVDPQPPPAPSGKRFALALVATGAIAGAAGAAVPLFVLKEPPPEAAPVKDHRFEPLTPDRTAFLPFGELTVNLNEGRLNRYLRIKIALQIDSLDKEMITKEVERKGLILRNWLLSHLSDKDQEEIRGAAGQNMLRREIRDRFNEILFEDGFDRVHDVLFEEFNVQ